MRMKNLVVALVVLSAALAGASEENLKARREFADMRFGVFLHWGLYALHGQGEWYQANRNIDRREYAKLKDCFNPVKFDAKKWARTFKEAGVRYVTLTSRHHEGFSMFATKENDYNVMTSPYGRDIVRELGDAVRAEGMKFHLYYSLVDWHLDEYPLGDCTNKKGWDSSKIDYAKYHAFMMNQLTELLTNYGPIGAIWFDGEWDHSPKTKFDWRFRELYDHIHALQPACLVGNNHHHDLIAGEDFQMIENTVREGQRLNPAFPLETCETMNGNWGYAMGDLDYKTVDQLVKLLVRNAARGANLLINIGPQPNGELPALACERLAGLGAWLKVYGETIYGTEAGPVFPETDVVATVKGGTTYLHFLDPKRTAFACRIPGKVESVTAFPSGRRVVFTQTAEGVLVLAPTVDGSVPDTVLTVKVASQK